MSTDAADDPDTGFSCLAYLYRRFGPSPMNGDGYKDLGVAWVLTTSEPDVWINFSPKAYEISDCFGYLVTREVEDEFRRPESERYQRKRDALAERLIARHPEWCVYDETGEHTGYTDKAKEEFTRVLYQQDLSDEEKADVQAANDAAGPCLRDGHRTPWRESSSPIRQRVNAAIVATLTDLLKPAWSRDVPFNVIGGMNRVPRSNGFLRSLFDIETHAQKLEREHRVAVESAIQTGRAEMAWLKEKPDPKRRKAARKGVARLQRYRKVRWPS